MRFFSLLLVLFASFLSSSSFCLNKIYTIRDKQQGYVLDAGNPEVSLQFFDGYNSQLWKFECAGPPGLYFIVNLKTWKALDIDRNASPNRLIESRVNYGSVFQQWYINSDGSIANAANGLYLKVHGDALTPGAVLDVDTSAEQKFVLQPRN